MTKIVMLRHNSQGGVMLAHPLSSPREGLAIVDVPDHIQPGIVARQYARVVVWPWRPELSWAAIADKPQGAIIR